VVVLSACTTQADKTLIGHYESKKFSLAFKFFYSPHFRFSKGMVLDIKSDSTFKYETCGNILVGNWRKEKNNLLLNVKLNYLKRDSSIQKNSTIVYEIKDNGELHRFFFGEKHRVMDFLVKK
jgi:hypothetical protein